MTVKLKLIFVLLLCVLPIALVLHFAPVSLPEAPVKAKAKPTAKVSKPRIVRLKAPRIGPFKKGEENMATYQMTGAAIGACNQNYSGASTPFVGVTDSGYALNLEFGDLARLRQGSTILYKHEGGIVGIYDTADTDNSGDVSTPEVTDISTLPATGSRAIGLMMKFKAQQG